jgi:hypothetical protein
VWLLSLYRALRARFLRGKATLITVCAGIVLRVGFLLALGPWTCLEEFILTPLGGSYGQGAVTAALDRIRLEGLLALLLGVVLAGIAFSAGSTHFISIKRRKASLPLQ